MTSIVVSAFGTDMLAVDDLSFSTAISDDDEESDDSSTKTRSSGGALYWLVLLGFALVRRHR